MMIYPGFDPKWRDVPDYILGITKEIWEDRHIHRLTDYYAPDLIVRSSASVVQGNAGIIAATQATLAEFPNRTLPGEDVIWCETGPDSFLSSHRLTCHATHTGAGMYGTPSGRQLRYRILADCWCKENAVHDEWLVRDQGAIVRQMGADIQDWTRTLITREGGPENCVKPYTRETDIQGPYQGTGTTDEDAALGRAVLEAFDQADFTRAFTHYDRAVTGHFPNDTTTHGIAGIEGFWLPLRAALPAASLTVDHAIGRRDPLLPPRIALRWHINGNHDGWGRFGKPSDAALHIMGITHFELGPNGIRNEWSLIDDTAVWKQILLSTGAL